MVNASAIPIYSQTLGAGTSFNNLIIEYEKSDSRMVETGRAISLEALQGAKGFAKIRYSFKGKFIDIPNIRNDLNTNFPHFKDGLQIKDVRVEVRAIGKYGNVVARGIYELEKGTNNIDFCVFNGIKEAIAQVNVELKSYSFNYSYSTTRTWD